MSINHSDENPSKPERMGLPESSAPTESRRRFIKGGLAVGVPAVLTLSSPSVLACHCKSPSAHGSLTGSQLNRNAYAFTQSKSYSDWMQPNVTFPSGCSRTMKFWQLFPGGVDVKICDLTVQFQKDLVTAALNIKANYIPTQCLTMTDLQSMAKLTYKPFGSSTTWTQTQIQQYLDATWMLGTPKDMTKAYSK
ncbi:hypothetical protein [Chitinimonas sp.]|uniref:hypothetical protein n=1 Tax=Chitinimonas sp. TaxID=1934313 RepID=UPI002F94DEFA